MINYFATCARGVEPILAMELHRLGASKIQPGRGGVAFAGDRPLLYRCNLWLRTAIRVLVPILEAEVHSPDDLYAAVQTISWRDFLTPDHTLAVDCNVRDSAITHSQYAARRVKDAICDQCRAATGRRPSVDSERPMIPLNLHIHRNRAVLSLDSSWESLHKRGYRPVQTRAPLNEALAAALILTTGWTPNAPFLDPLCGSGTLCIEAAWLALQRPPGLTRRYFGFMGWMDFDIRLWTALRDEARRQVGKSLSAAIVGSDRREDAIASARANARRAGIAHLLTLSCQELRDFVAPSGPPGMILCNPPYGERLEKHHEVERIYRLLGQVFAERCRGWKCWVLTSRTAPWQEMGLEPAARHPFWNGPIPCLLLGF